MTTLPLQLYTQGWAGLHLVLLVERSNCIQLGCMPHMACNQLQMGLSDVQVNSTGA
jgi:hypothetical protein